MRRSRRTRCGSFASRATARPPCSRSSRTAEVSESTFFRYFPTKADVVLLRRVRPADRRGVPGAAARADGPIQALRAAFRAAFVQLSPDEEAEQRERMTLDARGRRSCERRCWDQFASAMGLLAELVAERTGRPADELALGTLAGAVVGAAMAAMLAIADDPVGGSRGALRRGDGLPGRRARDVSRAPLGPRPCRLRVHLSAHAVGDGGQRHAGPGMAAALARAAQASPSSRPSRRTSSTSRSSLSTTRSARAPTRMRPMS